MIFVYKNNFIYLKSVHFKFALILEMFTISYLFAQNLQMRHQIKGINEHYNFQQKYFGKLKMKMKKNEDEKKSTFYLLVIGIWNFLHKNFNFVDTTDSFKDTAN